MTDPILAYMARGRITCTALEIAEAVGEPVQAVIDTLHALQDADRILMRNGFYWLSEAERARMGVSK